MTEPFSSSGMQRIFISHSLGNKRISPTSDQARIWYLLEEIEDWPLQRGKQKRKKLAFNIKLHCLLCPETRKTQFSPAGISGSDGRWSASYEGNREKDDNSSFSSHPRTFRLLVQMLQNMGCFYTTWEIEPLQGQAMCHTGMGTTAPEMPPPSPNWPHFQTHRIPPSVTGSWQVREGRHPRQCLFQLLT